MRRLCGLLVVVVLAGCMHLPSTPTAASDELITIESDPGFCMGHCRWFDLSISSDGRGRMREHFNDRLLRFRTFNLTGEQVSAVSKLLEVERPETRRFLQEPEECASFATDLGGYRVTWMGNGNAAKLIVNDGCGGVEAARARAAIRSALEATRLKSLPLPSAGVVASTVLSAP